MSNEAGQAEGSTPVPKICSGGFTAVAEYLAFGAFDSNDDAEANRQFKTFVSVAMDTKTGSLSPEVKLRECSVNKNGDLSLQVYKNGKETNFLFPSKGPRVLRIEGDVLSPGTEPKCLELEIVLRELVFSKESASYAEMKTPTPVDIQLTSKEGVVVATDAACASPAKRVRLEAGRSRVSFYFVAKAKGRWEISAQAADFPAINAHPVFGPVELGRASEPQRAGAEDVKSNGGAVTSDTPTAQTGNSREAVISNAGAATPETNNNTGGSTSSTPPAGTPPTPNATNSGQ